MTPEEMRKQAKQYSEMAVRSKRDDEYYACAIRYDIWLLAAEICERLDRIEAKGKGEAK